MHDENRPRPVQIETPAGRPPSDATVLFDGTLESVRRNWLWSAKAKGGRTRKVHWHADCEWAAKISAHNRRSFTGTRAELYNTLLAVLTAVTVVLGMRMMGAMLISSLIIFPALTARRLTASFRGMVAAAAADQ